MSETQNHAPFDKMMIVRTVVLLLAWLNQYLVIKGNSPLPISDTEITAFITFAASMWAWWKNNDVRFKARRNTQYLKEKGLK